MRFFGCAYYPEAWNTERRLRDIPLMQRAGFNLVRMGEFAWHEWEPAETITARKFSWKQFALFTLMGFSA